MGFGIGSKSLRVTTELSHLLADSYFLYLKTQNYHWNVTGNLFKTLHDLFEKQYNELALAIDEIAERIRILDSPAPGSFIQFKKLTNINEDQSVPSALEMIKNLQVDHKKVISASQSVILYAEKVTDHGTISLATNRIESHEKSIWMLSSFLDK